LSLAKDCYSMKLDLLTNATMVDDAIRFVLSHKSKKKLKSSSEGHKEESNEPDYYEDDHLEEEREEEIGEITTGTTNQVF